MSKKILLSNNEESRKIHNLIEAGLKSKTIKPLISNLFHLDETLKCSEQLSILTSNNVTIKLRDEYSNLAMPKPLYLEAMSKSVFDNSKTYIIVGGLGGFAIELAIWMFERGGRYFILTTRSRNIENYKRYCIERLRSIGVRIVIYRNDFLHIKQGILNGLYLNLNRK